MYESFYNLHPTPFRLTPDPHFFFESDTHKRGLAYLRFAFYQEEGFVVITGAPGTGKTELMLNLISELPRHKVTLAKIVTSNLDADDLLDLVAASFLIDPEHLSKGSLLKRLEDYFINQAYNGKHVLLLIDEAHNLSIKSLTELSMLSNFQINEKPVMQCFLLGQDSLEEKLNIPKLVHLKQRVLASTRLENLSQQETREYINHRLIKSGWDNNPIVRDAAFSLIFYYTKGVPRKINSLCNRVLLQSYLDDRHDIGADLVHQVIEELQGEILAKDPEIDLELAAIQFPMDEPVTEKLILPGTTEHFNRDTNEANSTNTNTPVKGINHSLSAPHSNVIAIPEFIKKKEASATPQSSDIENSSAVEPDQLASNVSANQLETPQLMEPKSHSINPVEDNSKTTLESLQKNGTPKITESNHNLCQNHSLKTPHDQNRHRQSGLVDKELQALASLCEPPSAIKKSDNNAQRSTDSESIASPGKKIIIDDLAYEQAEIIEEWNTESDLIKKTLVNFARHQNWRPAMIVLTLLAATGLSIYWLSDGKAEKINIANRHSPSEIVAKNVTKSSVIDLLLPEIKTTLIDIKHDPKNDMPPSTAKDPDVSPAIATSKAHEENHAAGTGTNSMASTAENTVSPEVPDSIAGHEKANQLDRQTASVVETNALEIQTAANGETVSHSPVKKQFTQSSRVAAAGHTSEALVSDKKPATVAKPTTQDIKTINKHQTTPPEQLAGTDPINNNTGQSTTNRMPMLGTPIALQDKLNTGAPDEQTSGTPMHDIPKEGIRTQNPDTTSQDSAVFISGSDLKSLLSTLAKAYESGNLQKLVSTFAADIYSSDGTGRKQMENDYRHLFNITDNRQLIIQGITWSQHDKQMLGNGDFRVRIREKGASRFTTYAGKISLAVVKESNNIVIRKLDYDYNN